MEKFLHVLEQTPLFFGIYKQDILTMLDCLDAKNYIYNKGDYICRTGDITENVFVLLLGSVEVVRNDFWGNKCLLAKLTSGDNFAESYACSRHPMAVDVIAMENTQILAVNVNKIVTTCPSGCSFHLALTKNLISVLSHKNLAFNEKIQHMSHTTTREKLLSYLSSVSQKSGSRQFSINLDRQQLADYLGVDRSAMSAQLCKLKKEGVLDFHKNTFKLL